MITTGTKAILFGEKGAADPSPKETWYASVMHHSKTLDLNGPSTTRTTNNEYQQAGATVSPEKTKNPPSKGNLGVCMEACPLATRNIVSVLCSPTRTPRYFKSTSPPHKKPPLPRRQIGRDRLVVHHVCKPVVNMCSSADLSNTPEWMTLFLHLCMQFPLAPA